MTLEERIAYLKDELKEATRQKEAPSSLNIPKLSREQRLKLTRVSSTVLYGIPGDTSYNTHRQARYTHTVDSEDYSATKTMTVPNASMTIEEIYKRISQGKPMADTNLTGMTSQRDAGYDSDAETRAESFEAMWAEPFTQPLGTLERAQEMQDRYNQISQKMAQLEAAQKAAKEQQDSDNNAAPSEVAPSVGYEAQRAAAKANKAK